MMPRPAAAQLGDAIAFTTSGGNHPPEVWADITVRKLIHVADSTPEVLRAQAHAFAHRMRDLLARQYGAALQVERDTLAALLDREGQPVAAAIIRART